MARWCRLASCEDFNKEVEGTPAKCATCGETMSTTELEEKKQQNEKSNILTNFVYAPECRGKLSTEKWKDYLASVISWKAKHENRSLAILKEGKYLFHATSHDVIRQIIAGGLCPRDPHWKGDFDASKDGYLSMATKRRGAGTLGPKLVMLRMRISKDINLWKFRAVAGSTEIRTTIPVPANKLTCSSDPEKGGWMTLEAFLDPKNKMKAKPALAVSSRSSG